MAASVCNVRVRRKPVKWGLPIVPGHDWIEILDNQGRITWSAGYFAKGNPLWSEGEVHIPDDYQGLTEGIETIEVNRTAPGHGTAFNCDDKSCDDIVRCVKAEAEAAQRDPGNYSLLLMTCRHWATYILTKCCIIKD